VQLRSSAEAGREGTGNVMSSGLFARDYIPALQGARLQVRPRARPRHDKSLRRGPKAGARCKRCQEEVITLYART